MTSLKTSFLILSNLAPNFGWTKQRQAKTGRYVKELSIIFLLVKTELIYLYYNSSKVDFSKTYIFEDFDDVIKETADVSKKFLHQNVWNSMLIVCTKIPDCSLTQSKVIRHGPTRPPQSWETQKSPVQVGLINV